MFKPQARTLQLVMFVGCLSAASCTSTEYGPELRQVADHAEHATGLRPAWADQPDLRELHSDADGIVSVDEGLSLSLNNNRALRADLEVIGQAKADLAQAGLLSNPMLSLMLQFPDAGGRAKFEFGLAKDFADLWLLPTRVRGAKAVLQQRILSFVDTALALVAELRTQYYTAQYQWTAAELQEQNLKILQDSMEIAKARLRAGDATQLDVNLIRSRYLEAEIELAQIRGDYRSTQRTLLRLMGVARAPDDWRPTPMSLTAPLNPLAGNESDLVEAALAQRFDSQSAWNELEAAAQDYQQQRWRIIQSLNVGLVGERPDRRGLPGRNILADTARSSVAAGTPTAPDIQPRSERRRERNQEIEFMLGPTLDVPLPIFDQNQAQIAKARYRVRELQRRYEETEQRVIEGVRSALTMRRVAEERARIFQSSLLPLQETNLQLAQTQYRSGQESILTVLLAQESLIRTQLGYAAALRDLAISTATLERQMAGPLSPAASPTATSQPTSAP